uniref:Neurotensin/neuromedin N n=1 Tax=Rhinopithecus bieti TaxID=61621 RepID=A0A2K6LQC1_RHIBE
MIAGMKIQLVCMLLLAFSSWSLCSGKQNRISQLPEVISFFSFLIQEDILDTGNDKNEKEEVIKRKIPYILKRQLYENKPRRPYILKRDSYYY